ncbi:MAG: hypothetical protein KGL10_09105 [Alphaproteobacteria bacterium]|nr:hypothetical protein [Alphaproteobacteria bacterium]
MIKKFFNWAAAKPSCQYTLTGDDLSFKFNRAGRLTERLLYVKPLLLGGAMMVLSVPMAVTGALPAAAAAVAVGGLVMAFGKAVSLVGGGTAHLVAAGANGIVNHVSPPKAPGMKQ